MMLRYSMRLCQRSVLTLPRHKRHLSFAFPSPRKLSEITDLEKLSEESSENVDAIWKIYHQDQVHAHGTTLTAEQHKKIVSRGSASNMFLLPVIKEDGHMWILSQFQDTAFICTYLGEYQKDPATAKPWLSCVLYDDFVESKGLSLVRTDFLPSLTKDESNTLTKIMLAMYCNDDEYEEYVTVFNNKPEEFNFEEYLEQFKTRKGFFEIKE